MGGIVSDRPNEIEPMEWPFKLESGYQELREGFEKRSGIRTRHIATVAVPENATWMIQAMRHRLLGKVVVEIGAGLGVLAVEMAKLARRVIAIESDPQWTATFVEQLYLQKPRNLMWICDNAQHVLDSGIGAALRADIAVVVTGSDEVRLRALAERFVCSSLNVIMPWQDWREGRAIVDYRGAAIPKLERPLDGWLPPFPSEELKNPQTPDWAPWLG